MTKDKIMAFNDLENARVSLDEYSVLAERYTAHSNLVSDSIY